jgi:hypothetical protein
VARFRNGYREMVNWTADEVVATGNGINTLEVKIDGPDHTVWLNGKQVATTSDSAYENGRIAFFCKTFAYPATCQLLQIRVWVPEDSPFPLSTWTPSPTP